MLPGDQLLPGDQRVTRWPACYQVTSVLPGDQHVTRWPACYQVDKQWTAWWYLSASSDYSLI